jgi:integrase/recombinase XerC
VKQEFLTYIQREKRYAPNTIKSYQTDLEQFQIFLSEQYQTNNLQTIDHHQIRSWLVSMLQKGSSARTVNRKISCLKSYFRFLLKKDLIKSNPMQKVISPKSGKKLPEYVKENELHQLLTTHEFEDNFEGIRNKLVIETFYLTGIRVSELVQVKLEDINLERGEMKIFGKGNKERIIPISSYLTTAISNYLPIRNQILTKKQTDCSALFITSKGTSSYSRLIYRIINKYLSYVSTNSKKSPHTLRHSFATIMLNHGAELNSIKEILGHASLAATQVYTHNSIEKIKSIYKQAHPRA